ncbi:MAG TPA: ABC transporter ATP-binding protein [Acetobacteraceae bacterium]|nr:ABC transporter ATP-binding protein [Acetobacteraceae bacterium]
MTETPLLRVEGLRTIFRTPEGEARAVDGISFDLHRGETLALVGESGSGKSVTSLSIMRLFPEPPGRIAGGRILFRSRNGIVSDLARAGERQMRALRGAEIGMIFQEPMTSLNPLLTIGEQVAEGLRRHAGLGRREAAARAVALLARVGIAASERRAHDYPHQFSGGMRQRAMIAIALACSPSLLIADEPTTALDVTIQGQILALIRSLQAEIGMGVLFVTHDLGVVAEVADRVAVMYAGRIVETGPVRALFARPRHPYTRALLASLPRIEPDETREAELQPIPGQVPSPLALPPGCAFAARCPLARPICEETLPALTATGEGGLVACVRADELAS